MDIKVYSYRTGRKNLNTLTEQSTHAIIPNGIKLYHHFLCIRQHEDEVFFLPVKLADKNLI